MRMMILLVVFAVLASLCVCKVEADDEKPAGDRPGNPPRSAGLLSAPLLRGTLWWPGVDWTRERLLEAVTAQHDLGFELLWICGSPGIVARSAGSPNGTAPPDIMEMIYEIADEKGMKVVADLPKAGWYGKASAAEVIGATKKFIGPFQRRYGSHTSFYGWYLNYEINPIWPDEEAKSAYWRRVWKEIVDECHRVAPNSVVTISPFFLLDVAGHRGFKYLEPKLYEDWWAETLQETGIDVLMLQDSGEHMGFYTLEQREPFFAAFANACRRAGTQFWLNVETGETDIADWEEFLEYRSRKEHPSMRFTPMEWLEKKLLLAAKYGTYTVNWGYFPFMIPDGDATQKKSYAAYKAYYESVKDKYPDGSPPAE